MSVIRASTARRISTSNVGAFLPSRVANLALWMDASDSSTVLLNGSNVAEWRSKANALTAAQAAASLQPAYTTAGQNGLNCVTFDGTGRRMNYNGGSANSFWSFLHDGTTRWVAYWVGSATAGLNTYLSNARQTGGSYDGNGLTVNHDFGILYGNPLIRAEVRSASGMIVRSDAALASATVGAIELSADLTNATAANRLRIRVNNGSQSSGSAGAGTISTANPQGPFSLGSSGVGAINGLNGRLCEIIIYRGAVSDSESSAIRSYLIGKWGL